MFENLAAEEPVPTMPESQPCVSSTFFKADGAPVSSLETAAQTEGAGKNESETAAFQGPKKSSIVLPRMLRVSPLRPRFLVHGRAGMGQVINISN